MAPRALRRLPLLAAALLGLLGGSVALAQALPRGEADIAWTSFVGGTGRRPARATLGEEPGTIELGETPWRCGYGRARFAAITEDDWSVQRVLACRREQATVSATASCRVHEGRLDEHAATLSLGTVDQEGHVTVTLGCQPR